MPARERRKIRWAAVHAGCDGAEWQRRLLAVARFLLALPAGAYLLVAAPGIAVTVFSEPLTALFLAFFSLATFSPASLLFGVLVFAIKEWAVRSVRLPADEEFEMLLNRVYPLRKQCPAAAAPHAGPLATAGAGAGAGAIGPDTLPVRPAP